MKIVANVDFSDAEKENYLNYVREKEGNSFDSIDTININLCENNEVEISYDLTEAKFERIRRITGYLAGTTDRWNNAKQSEEKDRVKHI
jgi:anaerobic ribonucleoside-triphosphate reductase